MKKIRKHKWITITFMAVVLAGVLIAIPHHRENTAVNANITNWGLSFQTQGEPPIGNADSDYLKEFDAMFVEKTDEKVIYLTFDAGFENGNTEKILSALKKHDVKAVFFLVGNYFETQPELVKRMVEQGHTIGNHTYSHPDMSKIDTKEAFAQELQKNEIIYKKITGEEMAKLYRPPQGKYSIENLKLAKELGYSTIFWSLAYVDWYENEQPTKEEAFSKLIPRIHKGAIVLLHSTSETNGNIMDELLEKWKNEGYTFGDLRETIGK